MAQRLGHLILDLPPGTGDTQLTLAQSLPLDAEVLNCGDEGTHIVVDQPQSASVRVYAAIALELVWQLHTAVAKLKPFVWKWDLNEGAPAVLEMVACASTQGRSDAELGVLVHQHERRLSGLRVLPGDPEPGLGSDGEKSCTGNRGNRRCDGSRSGEASVLPARSQSTQQRPP